MSDERQQDQPKSKNGKEKKYRREQGREWQKKTTNPNPDTSS